MPNCCGSCSCSCGPICCPGRRCCRCCPMKPCCGRGCGCGCGCCPRGCCGGGCCGCSPCRPLCCAPSARCCRPITAPCPSYWPPLSYTPPSQKIMVVVNNYLPEQKCSCCCEPCPCRQPQSQYGNNGNGGNQQSCGCEKNNSSNQSMKCLPDLGLNPSIGYTDGC